MNLQGKVVRHPGYTEVRVIDERIERRTNRESFYKGLLVKGERKTVQVKDVQVLGSRVTEIQLHLNISWVSGLMATNVCKFLGSDSIPSVCQIRDVIFTTAYTVASFQTSNVLLRKGLHQI